MTTGGPSRRDAAASRARAARESLETALRDPDIRAVEISWALSVAGDTALLVAGLLIAYDLAGALGVALLSVVRMAPATLVTLFADVPRLGPLERTLVRTHGATAVGALLVALAVAGNAPILGLLAIGLVAAVGALVRPAQLALFPALAVRPDQLLSANVAMSLGEGFGAFIGPLSAGIVVATAGPAAGALLAAGLLLLATVASIRVHVADAARTPLHDHHGGVPVVHGFRALAERPPAATLMASFGVQVFVRGALTTLLVLLAIEVLGAGSGGVGVLTAAIGLGGLVGALVALALGAGSRLAPAFSLALVGWGVPLVITGAVPSIAVAVVALGVLGVANAVLDVTGFTLLQRAVPLRSRAAVFALLESMVGVTVAAGGLVAPLLVLGLGVPASLVVAGMLLPLTALAGWRIVRRLDDEAVVPRRTAELLRGIPLFAALPLDALERVASAMSEAAYPPGATLLVEGEPGDRYLVVVSGAATVTQTGREIGRVGPGDGIGEIALLRQVPRTASVTALEPVMTLELAGEAFLAAVTGHVTSGGEADALVAARLAGDAARETPRP